MTPCLWNIPNAAFPPPSVTHHPEGLGLNPATSHCRSAAMNVACLQRLGITHVLNAAEGDSLMHVNTNAEFYAGTAITYHGVAASDTDHFDLSPFFEEAADFMARALAHNDGKGTKRKRARVPEGNTNIQTAILQALQRQNAVPTPTPLSGNEHFVMGLVHSLERLPPEVLEYVKFQIRKVIFDNSNSTLNLEPV
ncbi:dual specificity protein phosphatase 3b isoform X1 [Gadus chalcogrammus]|uniref:dual specificity protein phosphatase 3b isoform X1 n=1 Tax=Gadus chalcogrammus TaxID=1042646 RepID=UPI0024C25138|nr:dual specificity protein phosphatase 3b isoform X1 [Gadus chalcogrammus]